jgi:hypothetical protein
MTLYLKDENDLLELTVSIFRVYTVKPRRVHGTLKISTATPSKWHHIPGEYNLYYHHYEILKSHKQLKVFINVARNKSSSIQNYMPWKENASTAVSFVINGKNKKLFNTT